VLNEEAVVLSCEGDQLAGVLHVPAQLAVERGVVIVVGGPQYRIGSHRQFVLLARQLATDGIAALRFDHRGVGDSDGASRAFSSLDSDIRCAIDCLLERVPQLRSVVLWGLCDAASATLMYAANDSRVSGIVILNPWVRNPEAQARAFLRTYYFRRLFDADFWRSLFTGKVAVLTSIKELGGFARRALAGGAATPSPTAPLADAPASNSPVVPPDPHFVQRMQDGLRRFRGPALLILSGEDLTAQEFREHTRSSRAWRKLLAAERVTLHELAEANHTFSRAAWRDCVARRTSEWVRS
jgi:exosortase A-associated hydrolase 1